MFLSRNCLSTIVTILMETTQDSRTELVSQIRDLIVSSVNLKHVDTATITADTALAGSGLDLDSIDILEIVVAVEQRFGVKVKDTDDGKQIFRTLGTIADFVHSKGT